MGSLASGPGPFALTRQARPDWQFLAGAKVFVVDDDKAVCGSLSSLLRSVALDCETFASANEFLQSPEPATPACLVLDMQLLGATGFDVQQAIGQRRRCLPIIFLTGYGTIPMTVRAMKAGATAFLTKPFGDQELLEAIDNALHADAAALACLQGQDALITLYHSLTPRERQVMGLVVQGLLNKQVAAGIGTSEISVKVHRRQVMSKMRAASLPDLVRMSERLATILPGADSPR